MNVRVVECNTQEEWDYVIKKLGRTDSTEYKVVGDCVNLDYPNRSFYRYNLNNEDIIYTFKEWCNEFNHEPEFAKEDKSIFEVAKWYKVKWDSIPNFFTYIKPTSVNGEFIDCKGDTSIWHNKKIYSNATYSIITLHNPILITDLSEIQEFLPEGHPDKFTTKNTEPTKEEWVPKVGDWVVVKSYSQAKQRNGITKDNLVSKLYIPGFDNASGMLLKKAAFSVKQDKRFYNILKSHIIRKAEPWEIPIEEQTTEILMIDLSIPDFYKTSKYIKNPKPYAHFNYREVGDPIVTTRPLTPKESFKINKLPTKSWY